MSANGFGRGGFNVLVVVLTVLALGMTLALAIGLTDPPRSQFFWVALAFVWLIEMACGLLATSSMLSAASRSGLTGTSYAGLAGILGVYAVTGVVTIALYGTFRDQGQPDDSKFALLFCALTVAFFIVAAFFLGHQKSFRTADQPRLEQRDDHRGLATRVDVVLGALKSLALDDPAQRRSLDVLIKRLDKVRASLGHSHGAAPGAAVSGHGHAAEIQAVDALQQDLTLLVELAGQLRMTAPPETWSIVTSIDSVTQRVTNSTVSLGLS